METIRDVERLRPAMMQARPVQLEKVFDDPDAVVRLLRERSPYRSLAAFHNMQERLGGKNMQPFFREQFDDDFLLHNPRLLDAARQSFAAEIVRPIKSLVQINGPMPATGVHVDLPLYRGLIEPPLPVWLAMSMSHSGLFQDWMVPIASGLIWFYRGAGGAFAYWPDGPSAPPQLERGPFWNRGVMSDNEYMFHGVTPIGIPEDQAKLKGTLRASDMIYAVKERAWEIRDSGRVVHELTADQLRISILWKAYVFRDSRHLASFENPAMDLSLEQVVDIYAADLSRRGIQMSRPLDLLNDKHWQAVLAKAYPQPLSPNAADHLV